MNVDWTDSRAAPTGQEENGGRRTPIRVGELGMGRRRTRRIRIGDKKDGALRERPIRIREEHQVVTVPGVVLRMRSGKIAPQASQRETWLRV